MLHPSYAIALRGFYRSTSLLHLRLSFFSFLQHHPPLPSIALWQGVGEKLHAPGLQIQQTRTKHYIILSCGGGSSSTSPELVQTKIFCQPFWTTSVLPSDSWCWWRGWFGWGQSVNVHDSRPWHGETHRCDRLNLCTNLLPSANQICREVTGRAWSSVTMGMGKDSPSSCTDGDLATTLGATLWMDRDKG